MEPHLWGREGRRGSAMAPIERAMVVSYRLSIVTVACAKLCRTRIGIAILSVCLSVTPPMPFRYFAKTAESISEGAERT